MENRITSASCSSGSVGGGITSSGLARMARDWGYRGRVDLAYAPCQALLHGRVERFDLPGGALLYASDLTVLHAHDSVAELAPGLTVQLTLQGSLPDWGGGAASASVAAISDGSLRTHVRRRRGEHQRLLVLQFDAALAKDEELAERLAGLDARPGALPLQGPMRVSALLDELLTPGFDPLLGRLLAESCATELVVRALQVLERPVLDTLPACAAARRGLEKVCECLRTDPGAAHSLAALAHLAGMGVSTLKSRFTAAYGCSVFEFLRDQRLEQARRGLRQGGWSVKQAAFHCGFRHPANFATAYRRRFGYPPSHEPTG